MMRQILILTGGLAMPFTTPLTVGAADATPKQLIEIQAGNESMVFGRPVPITVNYRNAGSDIWIVREPNRSPDVRVLYRKPGDKGRPDGHGLGNPDVRIIKIDNKEYTVTFETILAEIRIKADATHEFTTDMSAQWSGWLVPGRWDVWIEDDAQKIESNRLEVKLWFTKESVIEMLTVARDGKQNLDKRKWHAKWLQKLKPDLKLDFPYRVDSEAIKKQKEPGIQTTLKEFADFWKRERDSESMTEAIRTINAAAGLKPPEVIVP